jgi:hypothetical protein
MPDAKEHNAEVQNKLDLAEYIPGGDLTEDREARPGVSEAERNAAHRRIAVRRKLLRGIPAVILALLICSALIEVHTKAPVVVQYIFLYFIFEAVFAENPITLGLSFCMLILFGLFMTGFLDLLLFIFLTFAALIIFLFLEKQFWLRLMNILVLGTWGLIMILVFVGIPI